MCDTLIGALPADSSIDFLPPDKAISPGGGALRFGPVFGPSSSSVAAADFAFTTASGAVTRGGATANESVSLTRRTGPVPPCTPGLVDRRETLEDGTVLDTVTQRTDGDHSIILGADTYSPDGTRLQAVVTQTSDVMTLDDLTRIVSSSGLRISAPIPHGTVPEMVPCDGGGGVSSDGRIVGLRDATRMGNALDDARLRALPATVVLHRPLAPMLRTGFDGTTLCATARVTAAGADGELTVTVARTDESPTDARASAPPYVDVVALPDGSVSARSTSGARTVNVTKPSGTRVFLRSTAPGESIPIESLEKIATAPGLDFD